MEGLLLILLGVLRCNGLFCVCGTEILRGKMSQHLGFVLNTSKKNRIKKYKYGTILVTIHSQRF